MFAARRDRLLRIIKEEGLDAVLVTSPINVTYLTGFSGDSSYLVVSPRRSLLVSDGRFTQQIAEECPGLETHIRQPTTTISLAAAEALGKLGVALVGFESGHLSVAEFESLREAAKTVQWKPERDRVERLRQVKDASEIEQVRGAVRIAERAFTMFRALLRPEDTEKDLADSMEMYVRRAGGKRTAFPTIVAGGARAALPHAPPTRRRVEETPLLLVDWGAHGAFYKSDLTRVLLTHDNAASSGAHPDPKIREVYEVVLRAQLSAIATVRAGVRAKDVDAAARKVIAEAGYAEYFTHSVGHGIGLQIHEAPLMRANTEQALEAGMIVTVEPGIYLPDLLGIRIEDDVLVTPDGCEVLTHVAKSFEECIQEW